MLTTEQVNEYLAKNKESQSVEKEPIKPETTEEVKETPAVTPDEPKGVEQKPEESKTDDKVEDKKVEVEAKDDHKKTEPSKEEKPNKQEQRDYAFIRLQNKRKKEKEAYEKRIKELEEELNKTKGLKAEHFVKDDGSTDTESYVNYKFKERDMQKEIENLKRNEQEQQLQYDIEEDKRRVANCFRDEASRQDYENLIATKGPAFYEAVSEVDKEGVVFNYLSSMPEYPIVLKELMTNPRLLGQTFRSTDPYALKMNIARIADDILNSYHTPKTVPAEVPVEPKKEMPIVGKQITNQTSNVAQPITRDSRSINEYLRSHPRH